MPLPVPIHITDTTLNALHISAGEVTGILDQVLLAGAKGSAWSAPKSVITLPDGRYIMSTLAIMNTPPFMATKSLVLNAQNTKVGLAPINSLVTLLHGETGLPLATLDGNWITGIRTAGLSALAARYLANPDAARIGFIGAGFQARWHFTIYKDIFPLRQAKIFGRGSKNRKALSELCTINGVDVEICDTPDDALAGVDLLVSSLTHTEITTPILNAAALAPGCFLSSVDLGVPWYKESFQELDQLFIDDLYQEDSQALKLAHPNDITGDLSGLVSGSFDGRQSPDDRTAFVFRGHGLGDLALAALAYQRYTAA